MFGNYFKTAWRNLLRAKSFSLINMLGLSIGLAGAMLILFCVQHELGFDQFHKNKSRLYQVYNNVNFDGELQTGRSSPEPLQPALVASFPDVDAASRYNNYGMVMRVGNNALKVNTAFVDKSFLSMFSLPLISGQINHVFKSRNSIVLTEDAAKKIFGNQNPVGKSILLDDDKKVNVTVTGILKNPPKNTMFQFGALLDWDTYEALDYADTSPHAWTNGMVTTFVLLKDGVKPNDFDKKIKNLPKQKDPIAESMLFLFPASQWHLYDDFENGIPSGGIIERVRLFSVIALFILIIACINFMNLSTARSERRAKEIGVRKVAGAARGTLIRQFITESILLAFVSGIIALAIVIICLPGFENLLGQELFIPYNSAAFWTGFVVLLIVTGLLAGSYPAVFLSSLKPVKVLKGAVQINGGVTPRKILVVLQFTFSIILIASTIVVYKQIKFASQRNIGFDKNQLITVSLNSIPDSKIDLIRNEILRSNAALSITKTMSPMTQNYGTTWGIDWEGKDPNAKVVFNRFTVDYDWVKTTGVNIIKGREIDIRNYPTDSTAIVLNEAAVKAMGFDDPIGKKIDDNYKTWTVIGVVKDFIFGSPYSKITPMVIEGPAAYMSQLTIKLNGKRSNQKNIADIENIFKRESPENLFSYSFVDEDYAAKFERVKRTAILSGLFSTLAIVISCLGLFGLAAYMVQKREKEIGVRKVLGASVFNIVRLLSANFILLVLISFMIATPVVYLIMNKWLNGFEYRFSISWIVFAVTGLLALIITLGTVSFQAVKAATANPVKSLRSE